MTPNAATRATSSLYKKYCKSTTSAMKNEAFSSSIALQRTCGIIDDHIWLSTSPVPQPAMGSNYDDSRLPSDYLRRSLAFVFDSPLDLICGSGHSEFETLWKFVIWKQILRGWGKPLRVESRGRRREDYRRFWHTGCSKWRCFDGSYLICEDSS